MKALASLVTAVGLVAGCAELPTPAQVVTDASDEADDGGVSGSPCVKCLAGACEQEEGRCGDDAVCQQYRGCMSACPADGHVCRGDCFAAFPEAATNAPAQGWERCRRSKCLVECVGSGGLFARTGDAACEACAEQATLQVAQLCLSGDAEDVSLDAPTRCERQYACGETAPRDPARVLACHEGLPYPDGPLARIGHRRTDLCAAACPYGRDFACVGNFDWPTPSTAKVSYPLMVISGVSGPNTILPQGGTTVRACANGDCAECLDPVAAMVVPDGSEPRWELINLPLDGGGFDGCLELTRADKLPTLHYWSRPIVDDDGGHGRVGIMENPEDFPFSLAVDFDPTRGHLYVHMFDCAGDSGIGVTFQSSAADVGTSPFYMSAMHWLPETGLSKTTRWGRGGLFNLPPGPQTIEATVDGEVVARHDVIVRPGWVTELYMWPLAQ